MIRCTVIGVDPGNTTGFARLDVDERLNITFELAQVAADVAGDFCAGWLDDRADVADVIVVWERFIITAGTAKKSRQPAALHATGAVGSEARRRGRTTATLDARDTKKLVSNALLRDIGWYRSGAAHEHAMDAVRQALTWLCKHRNRTFIQLLRPDTVN